MRIHVLRTGRQPLQLTKNKLPFADVTTESAKWQQNYTQFP